MEALLSSRSATEPSRAWNWAADASPEEGQTSHRDFTGTLAAAVEQRSNSRQILFPPQGVSDTLSIKQQTCGKRRPVARVANVDTHRKALRQK
jgi:hypothetical protein